jgi:hypothetical protein
MNRNVEFDEMVNWYSPLKIAKTGKAKNGDFIKCGIRITIS